MNTLLRRPVRIGLVLSTLVALLAFAARLAEAQTANPQHGTTDSSISTAPLSH